MTVTAPGVLEVRTFGIPRPTARGDVLVRMSQAAICGSDVHAVFGGFTNPEGLGRPGYPGHEGVGEIVDSHGTSWSNGTRVLTVPSGSRSGCFAEYQIVEEGQLVEVPAEGDSEDLVLAQQLGTTIFAMKKIWPSRADTGMETGTAVVLGVGNAGLFFVQHLVRLGFERVVVTDVMESKLTIARSLGATDVVAADTASVQAVVEKATQGVGADLVIEAAGLDATRAEAVALVRPHGTAGFFGYPERPRGAPFPVHEAFQKAVRAQWVRGAQREAALGSFHQAIDMILTGEVQIAHCRGNSVSLDGVGTALSDMAKGPSPVVKTVVSI